MAVLTEAARQQVWRRLMRYWSSQGTTLPAIGKADLRTAVDETDNWIDTYEGNTSPHTIGYNGASTRA